MFDAVTSFLNNYKSKIRNPLIGTIFSVWLIHNWRIVYALFNFDKECTMQDRINFIEDYFSKKDFWLEFFTIVGIAFGVILITFILLAISRFLTDGYYKIVEPFIINLLDKNTIFTHVDKKKLENKINELNNNNDRLRDTNSKLENQNIFLLNRNDDIQSKYDEKLLEISEQSLKSINDYELLQKKQITANKVIVHFENIINSLNNEMKQELSLYIRSFNGKESTNNVHRNFIGLQNELFRIGIFSNIKGSHTLTPLGKLFIEYFNDNDLPF